MDMHKTQFSTPEFLAAALCLLCLLVFAAHAQDVTNGRNVGFPPNGVFDGSDFENVQLNNGNLHIEIPLWSTAGRGLPAGYKYVYDSLGWHFTTVCSKKTGYCTDIVRPSGQMTLRLVGPEAGGVGYAQKAVTCNSGQYYTYSYTMTDPDGTSHHLVPDPIIQPGVTCGYLSASTLYADDGS